MELVPPSVTFLSLCAGMKIMESQTGLGWKGPARSSGSNPPAMSKDIFPQPRLLRTPSNLALNTAREILSPARSYLARSPWPLLAGRSLPAWREAVSLFLQFNISVPCLFCFALGRRRRAVRGEGEHRSSRAFHRGWSAWVCASGAWDTRTVPWTQSFLVFTPLKPERAHGASESKPFSGICLCF